MILQKKTALLMLIRAGHSRGGSHASKILWFFETGHKQAKMGGGEGQKVTRLAGKTVKGAPSGIKKIAAKKGGGW